MLCEMIRWQKHNRNNMSDAMDEKSSNKGLARTYLTASKREVSPNTLD